MTKEYKTLYNMSLKIKINQGSNLYLQSLLYTNLHIYTNVPLISVYCPKHLTHAIFRGLHKRIEWVTIDICALHYLMASIKHQLKVKEYIHMNTNKPKSLRFFYDEPAAPPIMISP